MKVCELNWDWARPQGGKLLNNKGLAIPCLLQGSKEVLISLKYSNNEESCSEATKSH